ncbi:hypothetical protein BK126_27055 [Paenibacillus sp. FSL H7-0326]|uniref:hypothetical protein n=1 Tax=Paenibacillus sp. FSL H7-0326 TaxID=1921144 RepID=UPI00096E3B2F|nr:hypothetical protein [Paenibacillus sp. FSL H7-0326]OMC63469.1 hypothetical protein BK126_27055 [Paenibacillus sp. FSL H7-0326]
MIKKWQRKRVKGFLSSLLIGTLLFSISSVALASDDLVVSADIVPLNSISVDEKIKGLYEQRSLVLAQKKEGYQEEYEKLGKELEALGGEFLTQAQVAEKMEIAKKTYNGPTPQIALPKNPKYVWSSVRNSWVKNGVTYEVQHLTAEPNSTKSILWGVQTGVTQSSSEVQAAAVKLVGSLIKEGASTIGKPVDASITFFDAVYNFITDANFGRTTVITDVTSNYTVSWFENIDFMYVKKKSDPDSNQELTFMSSSISGDASWTMPSFSYKSSGAVKSVKNLNGSRLFTYHSTTAHRNGSFAVAAYLDPSAPRNAYITFAEIKGYQDKRVGLIPVATPASPITMP